MMAGRKASAGPNAGQIGGFDQVVDNAADGAAGWCGLGLNWAAGLNLQVNSGNQKANGLDGARSVGPPKTMKTERGAGNFCTQPAFSQPSAS